MDQIIEKAGNFGLFQTLIFIATSSSVTACVMGMMFMMYGLYNPGWSCQNDTMGRETTFIPLNVSSSSEVNSVSEDRCAVWRECTNVVYDKSSSTVVTEWNLMCDNAWIASLMITVQMCGVLAGSWGCGPLGDRYGRKVSLYTSIAVHTIGNLVGAFSLSWQMFTALRFFIGMGIGGIVSIAFVYPMEFVGNWWRPVLLSVPTWSIGAIIFALVSFILKDWQHIHLVTASASFLAFLPIFWMPESMRWLVVHGKGDKLKTQLSKMCSWNRKAPVDVELINKTIENIEHSQRNATNPTYFDLFKTTKLRKYSIKFGLVWFAIALVYYMITFGVKSFSGNFYINMIIFALTEVPSNLLVGPFSNKFGRRFSACLFLVLSALACFGSVVATFVPGPLAGTMSIVMVTVSKGALLTAWSFAIVLPAELCPTVVRNLQSGYLNSVCRFGAMLSSYMIPSDDNDMFISFIVSGFLLLICTGLIASVSDSKRRNMADTIHEMKGTRNRVDGTKSEEITKMKQLLV